MVSVSRWELCLLMIGLKQELLKSTIKIWPVLLYGPGLMTTLEHLANRPAVSMIWTTWSLFMQSTSINLARKIMLSSIFLQMPTFLLHTQIGELKILLLRH